MTRLLSGLLVEYSTYDLKTCGLLDRECVLNPEECCSVSGTCFPKPIQRTLYYSPPSFLMEAFRSPVGGTSVTQYSFQPFFGTFITFFGANAVDTYFPFRLPLVSDPGVNPVLPAVWIWKRYLTVGYTNSPDGEPGPLVFSSYPAFALSVEFRITKLASPPSCNYSLSAGWSFKMEASGEFGDPIGFYGGGFTVDTQSRGPSTSPAQISGSGSIVDGYNQYNPYPNLLEFDVSRSVVSGDQTGTNPGTLNGNPPCNLLTSTPLGFELPPLRTYYTGEYLFPPTLQATISNTNFVGGGDFHGTYTLTWKHGKYLHESEKVLSGSNRRLVIEVFLVVGYRLMHRVVVRNHSLTGPIAPFTHERFYGRLQVISTSPYRSTCPNASSFESSPERNMQIDVDEV